MGIVRQLPELYLRGSLANITMANLTEDQKAQAQAIALDIAYSPEMASHRIGMIKELRNTIAADYKDDEKTGESEYIIAIYRGVIDVLHHHKYTFQCQACQQLHYTTKQGRIKAIDRLQVPCPNCNKVKVKHAGDTTLVEGSFVTIDEFQDSYKHHDDSSVAPTLITSIVAIKGEKKYRDPDAILNDPIQKKKLFGEYVWNYFRQQINENERKTHSKKTQTIIGQASEIYAESLAAVLEMHKAQFTPFVRTEGNKTIHGVMVRSLELLPEITTEILGIVQDARERNATVTITTTEITLYGGDSATTEKVKKDRVAVLDGTGRVETEASCPTDAIDNISYRSVGGTRMSQEDHIEVVDTGDALEQVVRLLPTGPYLQVFNILTQQGEIYNDYSNRFGDGEAKMNHISDFLGIPVKTVTTIKEHIKLICISKGIMPKQCG